MVVHFEDRPSGDIVFDGLDTDDGLEKLKKGGMVFKENCKYKISVSFRVQHNIVTGLTYINQIYKTVKVAKEETMLGSYPPSKDPHTITFPRIGWDEAPSGLLARGS